MSQHVTVLFVGETWKGSSARSLRECLERLANVTVLEIGEDHYVPKYRSLPLRLANRAVHRLQQRELSVEITNVLATQRPNALVIYKGGQVPKHVVLRAKASGVLTVNVYPDYSPHNQGGELRETIGEYDLVISTKPFHPPKWHSVYGYDNSCVCVPHGYDPAVHYWPDPPGESTADVVLVAAWRPEYHRLMVEFAEQSRGDNLTVSVAGLGWEAHNAAFPKEWQFSPAVFGRAYGQFLRQGRIVLAPVTREVVVHGKVQPGDEDTTRSYELAAAQCFFLHRRTSYAQTLYDERAEVPMWDDARELAALVRHYLPLATRRREMAAAAHARAVPAYSIPKRAISVMDHIRTALTNREARAL
jgi:hypothetical protein